MKVFDRFAEIYARSPYPNLSQEMAEVLPILMKTYKIPANGSRKLLDVACGEGSFAVAMAKKGWDVSGIDLSEEMLRLAKHRAEREKLKITFKNQDMRFLDYSKEFDLATCWFGSLNFLITSDDLQSTINNISRALKPNGWFLFDMNTTYGLVTAWQKNRFEITQETPELLEIHRNSYNFEKRLACKKITWFVKVGEFWEKYEERHERRAFSLEEIENCLEYAGLHVVDKLGRTNPLTPLLPQSDRVLFLTHK